MPGVRRGARAQDGSILIPPTIAYRRTATSPSPGAATIAMSAPSMVFFLAAQSTRWTWEWMCCRFKADSRKNPSARRPKSASRVLSFFGKRRICCRSFQSNLGSDHLGLRKLLISMGSRCNNPLQTAGWTIKKKANQISLPSNVGFGCGDNREARVSPDLSS